LGSPHKNLKNSQSVLRLAYYFIQHKGVDYG